MSLNRWIAPLALMLLTTACHAAPSPLGASLRGGDVAAAGKPQPYEKFFPAPVKPARFPVAVIAHRGFARVAPENTLSAFRAALEADADMLELDVHRTRDGHLVVMHDNDVDRTTDGAGDVEDMTLEQVKQLDAGAWFSPNFAGERVPTLDEVLALARGRANVMIELKGRKVPLLPPLVAQAVERHQMRDQVLVSSFYAGPLDAIRSLAPNLAIGALILPTNSPTKRAQSLRASMTQAFHKSIDALSVKAAHAAGLKVHVWTVNQPEDMVRVAKAGVDGIITDDVATCQQVLQDIFAQPPAPVQPPQPVQPPVASPEPPPAPEMPEAGR